MVFVISRQVGLCISRKILEAHGGMLGVESVIGRGSTFCFTLPLAPAAGDPASGVPGGATQAEKTA
jgi:light-regulated signal transduction histidine kinase (bacteriophytochrome)